LSAEVHDEKYWESKAAFVLEELMKRVPENKIRPRLEPTKRAVELLGDPQRSYRVIHITGTNGKTSTTRFIERILREHGLRTGRFTSPHLLKFTERMAIDGEPVSDEVLYGVYVDIEPILELVDLELAAQSEAPLTFFEALSVLGFAVFADAPVDVLVLEVGMGGAWDSTNVADGDVAVFTPVGLDHMDRLGNTISEIAETKSGIIKQGALVVTSDQSAEAIQVLKRVSSEKAEGLFELGSDFFVESHEATTTGQRVSVSGLAGKYGPYEAPVFGIHQSANLAVAIAAVEAFLGGGKVPIADDVLRSAVADLSSPGRLQLVRTEPALLLDGAHNPAGAKTLAVSLKSEFSEKPLVGLLAVLSDKDVAGVFGELAGCFERLVVTESTSNRSLEISALEAIADEQSGTSVEAVPGVREALERARTIAREIDGMVVVTGSISLVGDVLQILQEENDAE
jgi:dihydrofolate synthase / folylpolyglutamate synthase